MTVFTNLEANARQQQRLRELVAPDTLHFGDPENPTAADRAAFATAGFAFGSCPPEWLATSPQLRWMQFDSVGIGEYAHLAWDQLAARLTCTNLRGVFAEPVAETALAGLLALYRGLEPLVKAKQERRWMKLQLRPQLQMLAGRRVVLVGYGTIGRRFHELLAPFHCDVAVYGRGPQATLGSLAELDARLATADVVFAALPETTATRGLLDRTRLAKLPAHAILINVGRGSLVDEPALAEALQGGRLGGAVLDVTQEEPLPPSHPLWNCPNTIISQHTAGGSASELDRKIDFFEKNLRRYRQGQPLENIVEWKKGY